MNPKEINRRSGKIFRNKIPDNCAIRSQEDQEDYGIDYELELMEAGDRATGCIFKVQQKGQEKANYNTDGKYVIYSQFSLEKMTYYLKKIRIPVAISLVDIETESAFWTMLHGNAEINEAYVSALAANQKTLTIKIPVENRLPDTFEKLIGSVSDANKALIIQGIYQTTSSDLILTALKVQDFDALAKAFALHNDFARAEKIEQHRREGDFQTAFNVAKKILDSPSEKIGMRFSAGLHLLGIQPDLPAPSQTEREQNIIKNQKEVSGKLLAITRAKEARRSLKIYAVFLCRAARLHGLVVQDTGLFFSRRAQEHTRDNFTKAITDAARNTVSFAIVKEINRIQKYIPWLMRAGDFYLVPMVWEEFLVDLAPFIARLKYDGFKDSAQQLVEWFDKTVEIIINISQKLANWKDVISCSTATLFLDMGYEGTADYSKRIASIRTIIEAIPDDKWRSKGLNVLEIQSKTLQSHNSRPQTSEQEDEYYRSMAAALGVDLSNKEDKIAQVINIGIRDRNPERVLKNCQHLSVAVYSAGIPAQMMGLNTAGFKAIKCNKFGFGIAGLSLDDTYERMKERHCNACTSCLPHPDDWKWTYEWQENRALLVK